MGHLEAGVELQLFGGEMRGVSASGVAKVTLSGFALA